MESIPAHIFRAYDIRGIAGEEFSEEAAFRIGLAFGGKCLLQGLQGVAVGGDNRPSTPGLLKAFSDGLVSAGSDVFDVGLQPTPAVYFARQMLGNVGVGIITASHNPKAYNGVKLGYRHAALSEDEIQEIGHLANQAAPTGLHGRVRPTEISQAYREEWEKKIGGPYPLSVVVDCGNGTAGLYEPALTASAVSLAHGIFVESDPDYPNHHPDPSVPESLDALSREVLARGADLGVAYDGDADRIGVIDDRGQFVPLDRLMVLIWEDILKARPGSKALVEIKCSKVLFEAIQSLGGQPAFCRSGHAPIKIRMRQEGAPFAGELSGHFFFADDYYGYDDALYAAGRVYRLLAERGQPLSQLLSLLPKTVATREVRFDAPDDEKFTRVKAMAHLYGQRFSVVTVDGVRVNFPEGWALVRASNTQPSAVLMAEADNTSALRAILEDVRKTAEADGWMALREVAEEEIDKLPA